MPTFNSTEEMKAYILYKSFTAINAAANKAYEIIHRVLEQFYETDEPEYYIRTERLLFSLVEPVVSDAGNGVTGEVYFDASMLDYPTEDIHLRKKLRGSWYGHANWSGEDVLSAAMVGPSKNIWTNDTRVWSESVPILDSQMLDILKQELIKAGIPVR